MIERTSCPNGVTIVHEKMPYVRSLALGIWVGAGSADEEEFEAGIAHFIEHMLFKGTSTKSARAIAEEFDRIGGDVNAFTSKEMTCFYTTVLGNHAPRALTVLSDMFFNSTFEEAEIDKEKSIVLDEIAAVEDTPDDDVDERLWATMYPDQPIGRPVLGNKKTIKKFNKKMILEFMERMYTPERIVISIAGNYDDRLIRLIEVHFGSFRRGKQLEQTISLQLPEFQGGLTVKGKDIEQAHFCLGFSALRVQDKRIHDLLILDSVIGGAMSSRLFQEVREERGLAYSIYSYYSAYKNAGAFMIYGGTAPENLKELADTIDTVIHSVQKDGITENELHNAKEQLKCGFLLGLESSESRMHRNGKSELLFQEHKTADEVITLIDNVEADQVRAMASELFTERRTISIIAPEDVLKGFEI
ncbi:M16 family metallopeptidase [Sporosarcina limicola]|uniref:Zn-dependent peptidase n=1 Tax=Sporosarcina limicola TaxID=34101 RepID=A0A927R362_9BACL|nr:pitrilysin family protein [Sporosarcina limicola]MBE1553413.1 putative Zn-dependent peptidase [Sporosarcina limicola]